MSLIISTKDRNLGSAFSRLITPKNKPTDADKYYQWTHTPDTKKSFINMDPELIEKLEAESRDRLLSPRKYTPDPKKIPTLQSFCTFSPIVSRVKSKKVLDRCKTPYSERLYTKTNFSEELEKSKEKSFDIVKSNGASFTPDLETSMGSFISTYKKDIQSLSANKDLQNFTHLHITKDNQDARFEEKRAKSVDYMTRFNREVPRMGVIDVISVKDQARESVRVEQGKWQWAHTLSNHRLISYNEKPEEVNVHERKIKSPNLYQHYVTIANNMESRESFVKSLIKTENATKNMVEEKQQKIADLAKDINDPKKNPKSNLYFWPQFGKRMIAVQNGDKTRYVFKERPRSRENFRNVTQRLHTGDSKWIFPKVNKDDKSTSVKDQLDNYYPWQLDSVCKTVQTFDPTLKKMAPMANNSKTIVQVSDALKN